MKDYLYLDSDELSVRITLDGVKAIVGVLIKRNNANFSFEISRDELAKRLFHYFSQDFNFITYNLAKQFKLTNN